MDSESLTRLLTPEGWALLSALPPYRESAAISLGQQLRDQGHDPGLVAAALTQSRLRAKGKSKFGPFAEGMLFTAAGLEQATRLVVGARHAHRFTAAAAARVADLGCGIGGDSMAMAALEIEILAVERDEATASVATVNLRHWPHASVRHADVRDVDLSGFAGAFLDPARRTAAGKRVLDPRKAEPPLSFAEDVATRVASVGVKVAPGIAHDLVPEGAEAQWVSVDGDVVEAALWFGLTATDGVRRSALLLSEDPERSSTVLDDRGLPTPDVGPVGEYLYEPDGAVIRAGLVGHVAAQAGGRLLDRTIAYVTADRLTRLPSATGYRVEDSIPFSLKALRTYLRDRSVGRLTIKKRGSAIDPAQLRRQLRLSGDQEATIVLTRVAGRQSVLLVRPLD